MTIKISPEATKLVEAYAKKRNLDLDAAADKLVTVAAHRINATDGYAARKRGEKAPVKKAAPKAQKAKAAAKGALARKSRPAAKKATKEPKARIKVVNDEAQAAQPTPAEDAVSGA